MAVTTSDLNLVAGGEGDAPATILHLRREKLRAHRGLSMWSDRGVETGQELPHPMAVLFEHAVSEHGDGQRKVFVEEVPISPGNCRSVYRSETGRNTFDSLSLRDVRESGSSN
jgi:hypothetical protein